MEPDPHETAAEEAAAAVEECRLPAAAVPNLKDLHQANPPHHTIRGTGSDGSSVGSGSDGGAGGGGGGGGGGSGLSNRSGAEGVVGDDGVPVVRGGDGNDDGSSSSGAAERGEERIVNREAVSTSSGGSAIRKRPKPGECYLVTSSPVVLE